MDELIESLKLYFEPDHGTEFKPFTRLPIELRLKIWRLTWTPKKIWANKALFECIDEPFHELQHDYSLPDGNLPVTAWVNKESRKETLRFYRKFADSQYYVFDSYFNAEIDSLKVDVCARSLFRSFSPTELLGVKRLWISPGLYYFDWAHHFREGWDSFWFGTPYLDHDQPEYKSIGTLLHYVKPRYLSSLVHLNFKGNRIIRVDKFREDIRCSFRSLFFRYRDRKGGIRIVPKISVHRPRWDPNYPEVNWKTRLREIYGVNALHYLVGFDIFFLGPREAACIQGEEPAAKHRVWLDFVSIYLWHAIKPERLLEADGVTGFRTDPQDSFLL
ncbi:hypothetical protein PG984_004914 [Apiospora sp. TS-2023a]